jgi:hypothetical protein
MLSVSQLHPALFVIGARAFEQKAGIDPASLRPD